MDRRGRAGPAWTREMPRHLARWTQDRDDRIDSGTEQRQSPRRAGGCGRRGARPLRPTERSWQCDRAGAEPEGSPAIIGCLAPKSFGLKLIENSNQSHQKNRTRARLEVTI